VVVTAAEQAVVASAAVAVFTAEALTAGATMAEDMALVAIAVAGVRRMAVAAPTVGWGAAHRRAVLEEARPPVVETRAVGPADGRWHTFGGGRGGVGSALNSGARFGSFGGAAGWHGWGGRGWGGRGGFGGFPGFGWRGCWGCGWGFGFGFGFGGGPFWGWPSYWYNPWWSYDYPLAYDIYPDPY
jgi:hypothetical protein